MNRKLAAGFLIAFITIVGIVLYTASSRPTFGYGQSCVTHLKQIGTSLAMYESDNDDRMPLAYTFDRPKNWETMPEADRQKADPSNALITTLHPYTKNDELFLCPMDKNAPTSPDAEGLAGKMSYVHCLSVRGLIPSYSEGKRSLDTKAIKDPATTPLMRDPIRGTDKEGLVSPHGGAFTILYFDTHVRSVKPFEPGKYL